MVISIDNSTMKNSDSGYQQYKHECYLPKPNLLDTKHAKVTMLRKLLRNLFLISEKHYLCMDIFKSVAEIRKEKERHCNRFKFSIHPLSVFISYWEFVMIIILATSVICIPLHFLQRPVYMDAMWVIITVSDTFCIINIFINFLTGYISGTSFKYVVLNLSSIAYRYLKCLFLFDLLSCLPLVEILYNDENTGGLILLVALKACRIATLGKYFRKWTVRVNLQITTETIFRVTVLIAFQWHWNLFLRYVVEYFFDGKIANRAARKSNGANESHLTEGIRVKYLNALDRSAMMQRFSEFDNIENTYENTIFTCLSWLMSDVIMCYCIFITLTWSIGEDSSQDKYYVKSKEIKSFARMRGLPLHFADKILKCYNLRFMSRFYVEENIFMGIKGQLRDDMIMHTLGQLIVQLPIFADLPRPLLAQVAGRLKVEMFLEGDLIIKYNIQGDCMYFIDRGTVAVYTPSGKEICHLNDGDYFGEIALIMKHHFRTCFVLAVSDCQLLRLDEHDFQFASMVYPEFHESIRKKAIERYEKSLVADELHRLHWRTTAKKESNYKPSTTSYNEYNELQ